MKPIFTEGRRYFLAQFLGNTALVMFAGAFASDFFFKYPLSIKIILWLAILAAAILAFIISPERRE